MVLDKSPDNVLENLAEFKENFFENIPSIVLCTDVLHKAEFLSRLIDSENLPIIFVDMDLLYTGYVESGMLSRKNNVTIFHPDGINWKEKFSEIIDKVSKDKFLVIIDSFNGVYNNFDEIESARFINSCIMLLSSVSRQTNSSIIVTALARKTDDKEWILSPGGKQIIKSEKTGVFLLKKNQERLVIKEIQVQKSK